MSNNTNLSTEPLYNIRSVAEKTGLSPETMRAWERRYGFPTPYRNPKGYRLYTEDEIAALVWLKNQTGAGMTIGQAVKLLGQLRARGRDPVHQQRYSAPHTAGTLRTPEELASDLTAAILNLDEREANQILHRAFAGHPLDTVMLAIIAPTLAEVGDLWHAGEIPIAVEHFGTQLCRAHLIQAQERLEAPSKAGRIIAACAPGEWHEIGILMLTGMLLHRGWQVTYLGANMALDRFSEMIARLQPHLVLFSATSPKTARNLKGLDQVLEELPEPKPLIGLGGQAFLADPTLANQIPGTFLGPKADEAIQQIEQLFMHIV